MTNRQNSMMRFILVAVLVFAVSLVGCRPAQQRSREAKKEQRPEKLDPYKIEFKLNPVLIYYADENPAQVVQVTEDSLRALRIRLKRSTTTNLDGKFEGYTAMGREMHVHIVGQSPRRTLIRILAMSKEHDLPAANIVMTEIVERLRTQSYTMYSDPQ